MDITENSLKLFLAYAKDSGNWNGQPLVGGNVCILGVKEDRGNLTQLKHAGLLSTFQSDGYTWIQFSEKGIAFAKEHGVEIL